MNAEKYNAAIAHRLIESAHDPHAACRVRLQYAEDSVLFASRKADSYQRRFRISVAVNIALAGIVAWMVIR